MKHSTPSVADSLNQTRQDIGRYVQRYNRPAGCVQLLAVSKRKPVSAIQEAIAAGQRSFGENYVDEAIEKIQALNNNAIEWHYIGAIQSRKTASIAQYFHWAHGVDRLKIARRLADQRPQSMPALNICLQVNLDNEDSKAGLAMQDIEPLVEQCLQLPGITLRGLMAIPAPRSDLAGQRSVFAGLRGQLKQLQRRYPSLDTLSMGMSGDLEAAIAEGATIVRIGTAIFGARD